MSAVLDKPRLRIVDGQFVEAAPDRIATARRRFGRKFAHEMGGNYLEHPEPVLSRWSRRADYYNLRAGMPRPEACVCYFKEQK